MCVLNCFVLLCLVASGGGGLGPRWWKRGIDTAVGAAKVRFYRPFEFLNVETDFSDLETFNF